MFGESRDYEELTLSEWNSFEAMCLKACCIDKSSDAWPFFWGAIKANLKRKKTYAMKRRAGVYCSYAVITMMFKRTIA